MNGVEIIPSDSITYLGVVLDKKLDWNKHIQVKVSKCRKFLAMLRPAIKHHWGLSPKKVQWIWKQIILPCLTYGCHIWGHSLMKTQMLSIRKVARLALVYFTPMWKSTPTAGLEIILNQKPPHIEILGVAIKSYIQIKDVVNITWDGIAHNKRSASHLLTLKNVTKTITHEGTAIDSFESNHLREPFFNWNPPTCSILTIACDNDVDDNLKQLDFDSTTVNDNVVESNEGENPLADNDNDNNFSAGENQCVKSDSRNVVVFHGNQPTQNGLLYSHFSNNWEIIAQKLNQLDLPGALIIRVII